MDATELTERLAGRVGLTDRPIGVDPAVNSAIDLAFGYGLLQRQGSALSMTDQGQRLLANLRSWDVLTEEQAVLDAIGGKVTRGQANAAMSPRGLA